MDIDLMECFRKVTQASYANVEKRLSKYGLVKGQANLLVAIRDNDGCTQKFLADLFGVKYSSMSERLNKLEELGYIERYVDETNSKYKRICITSNGKSAATQCRRIQNDFNSTLYNGFSKKDLKQFEGYLETVMQNIENI